MRAVVAHAVNLAAAQSRHHRRLVRKHTDIRAPVVFRHKKRKCALVHVVGNHTDGDVFRRPRHQRLRRIVETVQTQQCPVRHGADETHAGRSDAGLHRPDEIQLAAHQAAQAFLICAAFIYILPTIMLGDFVQISPHLIEQHLVGVFICLPRRIHQPDTDNPSRTSALLRLDG